MSVVIVEQNMIIESQVQCTSLDALWRWTRFEVSIDSQGDGYHHVSLANQEKQSDLPVVHLDNVINVVAHGHEQVKEHPTAALHLHLHSAATFECTTAADDESQIMGAKT